MRIALLAFLTLTTAEKGCSQKKCNRTALTAPTPKAGSNKCNSGLAGDIKTQDCHQFVCDGAGDVACSYCKCKRCPQCLASGKKTIASSMFRSSSGGSTGSLAHGSSGGGSGDGSLTSHHHHSKATTNTATTGHSSHLAVAPGTTTGQDKRMRFDFYCGRASCEKFCRKEFAHHHCYDCKCKGCSWCASYKCEQPTCDAWCDLAFKKFHCPKCKCRACKFCQANPPPPSPPPLPPPPSPPMPPSSAPTPVPAPKCSTSLPGDEPRYLCTPLFCQYRTRDQDCAYCKCRACDFCSIVTKTSSPPSDAQSG